MLSCQVPSGIRYTADRFKDLFVGRLGSYSNLCSLFCLFLFGLDELSTLVRACPWTHSVSDLSRAVKCFDGNRMMRRVRASILRRYGRDFSPEDFHYAVDDTANPRYGKSIFRCGAWHSSSGPYRGQKILVLVLVDVKRNFALPIGYEIVAKKGDTDYLPAHKLACGLLGQVIHEGFPKLPVAADSWFDSVDFMADLEAMELPFAGEIKSNRKVKPCPSPKVCWRSLKDVFQKIDRKDANSRFDSDAVKTGSKRPKSFSQRRIWVRKRRSPLNVVAVYNRKNGLNAFAYYATTDLSMAGARLWEISRGRWKIECLFRDMKQSLSFGRLPCIGAEAAHLSVCIPFALVVGLRLDEASRWGLEERESLGRMIEKIKEIEMQKSINILVQPGSQSLKSKLQGRRQLSRVCLKPVDQPAEAA